MPMRRIMLAATAFTLFALACAPGGHEPGPAAAAPPPGSSAPAAARSVPISHPPDLQAALCAPILIEPDLGFGTNVVMRRLPDTGDMDDLRGVNGLRQIVIALPEWPADYSALAPLQQAILPDGAELVVLLPGWPPSRAALDAWNLIGGSLRLILVVSGPPADRALISELNRVRSLERVIAQMEHPDRSGFERLQRPLSFRVVRD
ncbi:MAG TPA: hypothetical protein VN896_10520 [Methylomirabilota bacterium]|nr:hypothetical protein [Methylomirabilota bacterium]